MLVHLPFQIQGTPSVESLYCIGNTVREFGHDRVEAIQVVDKIETGCDCEFFDVRRLAIILAVQFQKAFFKRLGRFKKSGDVFFGTRNLVGPVEQLDLRT